MQTQYKRLTASQWENIKEYFPVQRKRKYELREVVNTILWQLRVGAQWRNLPDNFAPWQSVYYYFRKWQKDGTLQKMNEGLNKKERKRRGKRKLQVCYPLIVSQLS